MNINERNISDRICGIHLVSKHKYNLNCKYLIIFHSLEFKKALFNNFQILGGSDPPEPSQKSIAESSKIITDYLSLSTFIWAQQIVR